MTATYVAGEAERDCLTTQASDTCAAVQSRQTDLPIVSGNAEADGAINATTIKRSKQMAEKKDVGPTSEAYAGAAQNVASQESVNMLIRLLQEFERRTSNRAGTVSPEVERDIDVVDAGIEVIRAALELGDSPMRVDNVFPPNGSKEGDETIRIVGSHFVFGATVRLGTNAAREVRVVGLDTIEVKTPPIERTSTAAVTVDVVVDSIIGTAKKVNGFTYNAGTLR